MGAAAAQPGRGAAMPVPVRSQRHEIEIAALEMTVAARAEHADGRSRTEDRPSRFPEGADFPWQIGMIAS
jgi:hypothetical protein